MGQKSNGIFGNRNLLLRHEVSYMIPSGVKKWRLNSNRRNTASSIVRTRSPKFDEDVHIQVETRKKVPASEDENLFFSPFLVYAKQLDEHVTGNIKSIKGVWKCEE